MRAALLLLLAATAAAEDAVADLAWEPGHVGTVWFRDWPLEPKPPEGVRIPADLVDGRFGHFVVADGVRVAVAHEAGGGARGLWVDTDLDGDLAEETPALWTPSGTGVRASDTVKVPIPGESEPLPALFMFRRHPADAHDRLGVVTRIHRRGWIEIGARLRPVALVDGNGDLRFDDPEHDRVYLDLDGDGDLEGAAASYEMLRFGEEFALARSGYAAEAPEPWGTSVSFRRLPKAPAPRRWISGDRTPPPVRRLSPPPTEPFSSFAERFEKEPLALLPLAARYGTADSFRLLLRVAEKGSTAALRAEAVRQMGYAEYVAHADDVARLARTHPELEARRAAVRALHAMGAPGRAKVYEAIIREARDDAVKDLVEDAARHLAHFGTAQSRAALLAAFRDHGSAMLRLQVFQGGTDGDPAGPPKELLHAALEDRSEWTRYQALEKCWRVRDPKARAVAIDVLSSREDMIFGLVAAAIRVLAYEPDDAAMRALLPWAERGSDNVWNLLSQTLRHARDPEVTRAIIDGLREPGVRTRCFCTDLLTWMSDPGVVPALLKATAREKDAETAGRMIRALGTQEGVPLDALLKLANRKDFPARGELLAAIARVGKGDPRVIGVFRTALASASWEERVLALDVAATTGDPALAPAILACLGHEAWQVRLAAVEALRGVRVREAVLPLVERLEREESARVRVAIGETLFNLTGENLLDAAAAWRRWWTERGATFAVPPAPPVSRPDASGGTVARFYGLPVRTERVCFILDRSDSMEGIHAGSGEKRTRLQVAVQELLAAVERLPDRARVNVVLFDDDAESWRKSLAPLTAGNRDALRGFLEKQTPRGGTNLFDGLEAALLMDGIDTIFLLSDGAPSRGRYRDAGAIARAVRQLNQTRRIAIHTVAIGIDSPLLRRLAEESGGRYARR
jgi:HEAT repeat protein